MYPSKMKGLLWNDEKKIGQIVYIDDSALQLDEAYKVASIKHQTVCEQ